MRRRIKNIICIVILLSFVSKNFCSLLGTEAEGFLTKAEFDSAISDFNSRLSSFESSINSKIDTQVSSYLDRNGIWSGKEQDLIISTYIQKVGNASHGTQYYALHNPPNSFATNPSAPWATNDFGPSDFLIANKAGLLVFDVETCGAYDEATKKYSENNSRGFSYILNGLIWGTSKQRSKGIYLAFEIYDVNDNLKLSIPIGKAFTTSVSGDMKNNDGFCMMYENFAGLYQCFVGRDQVIKCRIRFMYNLGGKTTSEFTFHTSDALSNEWNMLIKSKKIY